MSNKQGFRQPKMQHSFHKQNQTLAQKHHRLDIEIIRVHSIQKQRSLSQIWNMTQQDLCDFFTQYEPFPNLSVSLSDLIQSQRLKLIKAQGKIYFGEVQRGRRQGKGISYARDGRVYQGCFYKNQKTGQGIEIYPNSNVYIGQFLNGKKHGQGRFYWFSLSSKNPNKDDFIEYFEGYWWGGLPDGPGTHQKMNGDLYTGTFKNGLKHGEGKEWYGNGDFYQGQLINGMPQGYGEYTWSDGSTYKGDFRQGLRNGYGVWKASTDALEYYKGHFVMDKKSGYGIYCWQSGWKYHGNFEGDYRNGYGELYDSQDKLIYRGFWENGQQTNKEPVISLKQQQIQFKSAQYLRRSAKHLGLHQQGSGSENKASLSSKFRSINQNIPELTTIFKTAQLKMKKRPFSHNSKASICLQGNQNNRVGLQKTERVKGRGGLVGTIKSNLFVACRIPVRHNH